ncbi:MAG TPA: phosphotransferase [Anaeromyxobacteraceae bacterium]|nr:phosphotransferase [Anaeromyxobacteraceae bacterium]
METSESQTARRVRRAVERATGRPAGGVAVRRLAGHASLRSYWRVGTRPRSWPPRDRDGIELGVPMHPSHVVMVLPPDAAPEEVTKGGAPGVNPFVDVQRYLEALGVRVPHILAFYQDDPAGGLMVLEDLGDEMLETRLLAGAEPEPLYGRAVDQLAVLRAGAERSRSRCVAFTRGFDFDLYLWELHHFREWLLEAWKGATLSATERAELDWHFASLARALDAEPKGFTHRDYQSRNLMALPTGELAVIDFQDALLGPRQYDLVALLRDSYVELPDPLVERMLQRYLDAFAQAGGPRLEMGPFREVFDLLTVQRKLKDAGRFVYIDRVKKNPDFLRSIPASLRYVREALGRLPGLRGLQEVLGRHVPELAR